MLDAQVMQTLASEFEQSFEQIFVQSEQLAVQFPSTAKFRPSLKDDPEANLASKTALIKLAHVINKRMGRMATAGCPCVVCNKFREKSH